MESEAFHLAALFRQICYLVGLSVYLGTALWLARAAFGKDNRYGLGQTGVIWAARVLAFFSAIGLIQMLMEWDLLPKKTIILSPLALLYLLAAYGLTNIRERPFPWPDILTRRLARETVKSIAVVFVSIIGALTAMVLGMVVLGITAGLPPSFSLFMLGLLLIAPLVWLYSRIKAKGILPDLKLTTVLGALIFTCLLLLLPELLEHIGNSPKVDEMLHAPRRLGKV